MKQFKNVNLNLSRHVFKCTLKTHHAALKSGKNLDKDHRKFLRQQKISSHVKVPTLPRHAA